MAGRAVLLGRNSGGLEHCPRDVNLMHEALRAHRFKCRVVPESATLGQVTEAVVGVIDACGADDTLVVYFSGHSYGDDGLQLVLDDQIHVLRNQLSGATLVGWLRKCRAQNKLLILDSCQSGQAAPDDWPSQPGDHFRVLTATDGRSSTKEHDALQAGAFTYHLHLALTDAALRRGAPAGVLTEDGHLSVDSLYPWLRRAVADYDRVEGKQPQAEPQLYGSTAKDVFFGFHLAPAQPAAPDPRGDDGSAWDGYLDDPWLLKTLDRAAALAKLRALLKRPGTPHLVLVDAVYETDRPDYLADCAMLWPEQGRVPIPAVDAHRAPAAYELELAPDALEPADLYRALHGAILGHARDDAAPEHAVCAELRSRRHAVLCCMLGIQAPSPDYLRRLRLAQRFLADLCTREPDLAVVLLVACQPPEARFPWWWPLWTWPARLTLRGCVHWLGRLGQVNGNEVANWRTRWLHLRDDPRVRLLHDAQVAKLNREARSLGYEEMRAHLRRVWDARLGDGAQGAPGI